MNKDKKEEEKSFVMKGLLHGFSLLGYVAHRQRV
jgi:hypothetical protein